MLRTVSIVCVSAFATHVWADEAQVDRLADLMRVDDTAWILAFEGQRAAEGLRSNPELPASAEWTQSIAAIYDAQNMHDRVLDQMHERLDDVDLSAALEFYESDLGVRLVEAEITSRAQISNPDIHARMEQEALTALTEDAPHLKGVRQLIEVNDLIGRNVENGMNSRLALLRGIYADRIDDSELTSMVMDDYEDTERSTRDWVYTFMNAAYSSFTQEELLEFAEFLESDAGQDVTNAAFDAFGTVFVQNSAALGQAVALDALTQLQ